MPKEYRHLEPPRTVWVRHRDGQWYAGRSVGRLRWSGCSWSEQHVEYSTGSGETHDYRVPDYYVCSGTDGRA